MHRSAHSSAIHRVASIPLPRQQLPQPATRPGKQLVPVSSSLQHSSTHPRQSLQVAPSGRASQPLSLQSSVNVKRQAVPGNASPSLARNAMTFGVQAIPSPAMYTLCIRGFSQSPQITHSDQQQQRTSPQQQQQRRSEPAKRGSNPQNDRQPHHKTAQEASVPRSLATARSKPSPRRQHNVPSLPAYRPVERFTHDIDAVNSLEDTTQLLSLFRNLQDAQNWDDTERLMAILTNDDTKFKSIPPQLYATTIQTAVSKSKLPTALFYLKHSMANGILLSGHLYKLVTQQLANGGYSKEINDIIDGLKPLMGATNLPKKGNVRPTSAQQQQQQQKSEVPPQSHLATPVAPAISSLDHSVLGGLYNNLITALAKSNQTETMLSELTRYFSSGTGLIVAADTIDEACKLLFRRSQYQMVEDLLTTYKPFLPAYKLSRLYSRLASTYLNLNATMKVNHILQVMEQSNITPSPIMLNSLLYHIIRYRGPIQALKWYRMMYAPYSDANALAAGDGDGGVDTATSQPSDDVTTSTGLSALRDGVHRQGGQRGKKHNLQIANIVLEGLLDADHLEESMGFLVTLPCHISTVNIMLKHFLKKKDFDSIRLVFKYMTLRNLQLDTAALTTLVQTLGHSPDPTVFRALLHALYEQGVEPTLRLYTPMISALCQQGFPERAEELIEEMRQRRLYPNVVAYTTVMGGYVQQGRVMQAMRLKSIMEKRGLKSTIVTYQTLLDGANHNHETMLLFMILLDMFRDMPDLITTMDTCHNVTRLLRDRWKVDPNDVTYHQRYLITIQNYVRICARGLNKLDQRDVARDLVRYFCSIGGNDLSRESPTAGIYRRYDSFDRFLHHLESSAITTPRNTGEHDGDDNEDNDMIKPPSSPQQQNSSKLTPPPLNVVPKLTPAHRDLLNSLRTFGLTTLQGFIDTATVDSEQLLDSQQPSFEPVRQSIRQQRAIMYDADPFLGSAQRAAESTHPTHMAYHARQTSAEPSGLARSDPGLDAFIDQALLGIQKTQTGRGGRRDRQM